MYGHLMRSLAALSILVSLLGSGCYAHHGSGDEPPPVEHDATLPDAGRAVHPDAGPSDSGPPPLPREPEPDPGPDGRPSDDPSEEWEEPPVLDEDEDCCVLGETHTLPGFLGELSAGRIEPPPVVGWGPGEWGVALSFTSFAGTAGVGPRLAFYRLAADGASLGPPSIIHRAPLTDRTLAVPQDVRWAAGRWSVPLAGDQEGEVGPREAYVHLIDAVGTPAALIGFGYGFDGAIDAPHLAHGDRWLGIASDSEGVHVRELDELAGAGATLRLPLGTPRWLRTEALGSRVAVVAGTGSPDRIGPAEVTILDPDLAVLGRVPLTASALDDAAVARVRDQVVVAIEDGEAVYARVVDPFALSAVGERVQLGRGRIGAVDVAGSDKFGVAGVCWAYQGDDDEGSVYDGVRFRLVGPDGRPLGRAVTISERPVAFRGIPPNCSVGSDGRGFLILWHDHAMRVRRVDLR